METSWQANAERCISHSCRSPLDGATKIHIWSQVDVTGDLQPQRNEEQWLCSLVLHKVYVIHKNQLNFGAEMKNCVLCDKCTNFRSNCTGGLMILWLSFRVQQTKSILLHTKCIDQLNYCQFRARRALMLFYDVLLRTRRVLSLYNKVYGDSTLLILNGTSLNGVNALLALSRRYVSYISTAR